jgi:hypothetical protein
MAVQGIPNAIDWIEFLELRKAKLTDPDDVAKVDNFIQHLLTEYKHDFEGTLATMAPDGLSRCWGGGPMLAVLGTGGTNVMTNVDRKPFYEEVTKASGEDAFKFVAMDTERFFVGEDGIVLEGVLWNIVPGDQLALWNADLPVGADPNGTYGLGQRMALFMSYRDGKIVGEDTYWDANYEVREIHEPVKAPVLS